MTTITKSLWALLCAAGLLTAARARADLAPPDVSCTGEGSTCNNAAPGGIGAGVCTPGVSTTQYGRATCLAGTAGAGQTPCLFCQAGGGGASSGGSAGAAGTGAETAGTSSGGSAGTSGSSNGSGGGCNVGPIGTEKGIAGLMLAFGALALGLARRKRGAPGAGKEDP